MPHKADRDQIRRQNRSIILQALRREGQLARIELGQITKLSPATVTSITGDLLDQGLIEGFETSEQKGQSTRGRPRSLLRLTPNAAYVVCVRLSVQRIDLALVDYSGQTVAHHSAPLEGNALTSDTTSPRLVHLIRELLTKADAPSSRVQEIGLIAQGAVDVEAGTIIWSPAIDGRNTQIVEPLSAAFDAHCTIVNDTNMITEALHWSDPEKYAGTFVVVFLDFGMGMGLHLDGRLFCGANGKAAEIGHTNHMPDGALCQCGKKGCFEAYLSENALSRIALAEPSCDAPSLDAALDYAACGNRAVLHGFQDAGRVLGFALARIIAMFDPRRIVVTGRSARALPYMQEGMSSGLEDGLIADLSQNYEIDVVPWDEDYIIRGMAAQALTRLDLTYKGMATR